MASFDDILSALKNGVTAINNLNVTLGGATTVLSFYGFNNITSAPTTVVAGSTGDTWPTQLSFHNPSSAVNILVYPSVDGNGATLSVASTSPGGAVLVYSNGGSVEITGGTTMAWSAISTGTGSLTVSLNA
jgi:hypothetical protein